jgi:hypothetical protein
MILSEDVNEPTEATITSEVSTCSSEDESKDNTALINLAINLDINII